MSTKYDKNSNRSTNLKIRRKSAKKTTTKIVNVKITDIKPTLNNLKTKKEVEHPKSADKKRKIRIPKALVSSQIENVQKNVKNNSINTIEPSKKSLENNVTLQTATLQNNQNKNNSDIVNTNSKKRLLKLNIATIRNENTASKPDTSINQNSTFFYTPSIFKRYKINITNVDDVTDATINTEYSSDVLEDAEDVKDVEYVEDVEDVKNVEDNKDAEDVEDIEDIKNVENVDNINNIETIDNIDNNKYNLETEKTVNNNENTIGTIDITDTKITNNISVADLDQENESTNKQDTIISNPENTSINETISISTDSIITPNETDVTQDEINTNTITNIVTPAVKPKKGIFSNLSSVFKNFSYEQNELIDLKHLKNKLLNLNTDSNLENDITNTNIEPTSINNMDLSNNPTDFSNTDLELNNTQDISSLNNQIVSNNISIDMNSIDFDIQTSTTDINNTVIENAIMEDDLLNTPNTVSNQSASNMDIKEINNTVLEIDTANINITNDDTNTNVENNVVNKETTNTNILDEDTNMFNLDNTEYDEFSNIDYSNIDLNYETDDDNEADFSIEDYFGVSNLEVKKDDIQSKKKKKNEPNTTINTNDEKEIISEENQKQEKNSNKTDTTNSVKNTKTSEPADLSTDNLDITLEDLDTLSLITSDDINNTSVNSEIAKNNEDKKEKKDEIEENDKKEEIENILSKTFSKDNVEIDEEMKNELLTELLNVENENTSLERTNTNNTKTDNNSENTYTETVNNTNSTKQETSTIDENDEFFTIIDTLAKTITQLESSADICNKQTEQINEDGKTINILINKDDIFSISILNETYEIVADFDGISVLSENINISTPKKNFYVTVGEKYIEIHNTGNNFAVTTNFEDIEFANAINNVAFTKKNNKIELSIKEAFKLSSVNNKIELSMLNTSVAEIKTSNVETSETVNEASICDNRTLLISEETQKVYLPYTIEELMKKLNNSDEYQTLEDVIENEYTVPLSTFKMPIVSRFKEAYRFMRTKEHSSVYAALDLAIELMFNSNLNPAVIRASKDLKELNVYLDCLYENEIEKFDCFKIVYKVLPKIRD